MFISNFLRSVFVFFVVTRKNGSPDAEPQPRPVQDPRRKKTSQRIQNHGVDGKFAPGTITVVVLKFPVCTKTIRNIWARAVANFENLDIRQFVQVPKTWKKCLVVHHSGTMILFMKRSSWFPSFRGELSGTLPLHLAIPS